MTNERIYCGILLGGFGEVMQVRGKVTRMDFVFVVVVRGARGHQAAGRCFRELSV